MLLIIISIALLQQGGGVRAVQGGGTTMGEESEATPGGSWMDTLGCRGGRMQPWPDEGGPIRCHNLNRSRRLAMALTWEKEGGSGALVRAPDIT